MAAQSELYQLYADTLFAICLKYSRNYEDAEDTLQDSFLTIFKKINQFNYSGSFEGWLKKITIHTALQKYRKKSTLQLVNDVSVTDEIEVIEFDYESLEINFLLNLIQKLPDRYRLVFNLYVMDNYSHKEISEMLNISIGTSKSNLSRARQILKNEIEIQILKEKKAQ